MTPVEDRLRGTDARGLGDRGCSAIAEVAHSSRTAAAAWLSFARTIAPCPRHERDRMLGSSGMPRMSNSTEAGTGRRIVGDELGEVSVGAALAIARAVGVGGGGSARTFFESLHSGPTRCSRRKSWRGGSDVKSVGKLPRMPIGPGLAAGGRPFTGNFLYLSLLRRIS